jgi:hypothetical protein
MINHALLWLWIPGSALAGCPGMTARVICPTSGKSSQPA